MPGVTISAGYGAGGSIVAPDVARRLGLPLLDRAISSRVAAQLRVTVEEAEGGQIRRSLPDRFFAILSPLAGGDRMAKKRSGRERLIWPPFRRPVTLPSSGSRPRPSCEPLWSPAR